MKTYALIVDGFMVERISPATREDGSEIPIAQRFHPDIVARLVEIDPLNPPPSTPPAAAIDGRPAVLADFRARRDDYLDRLAGIAVFTDDQMVRAAAKTFRQRLLDIPQNASVTGAADAASMELAIVALYRAAAIEAVSSAPAGKAEFDRIAK